MESLFSRGFSFFLCSCIRVSVSDLYIIGTAYWTSKNKLLVPTFNRHQNSTKWHTCRVKTGRCIQVYKYEQNNGWIHEMNGGVSEDGSRFVVNLPAKLKNENASYMHLVSIKIDGTEKEKAITKGRMSVIQLLGWDHKNGTIYFTGTFWNGRDAHPGKSHVYSISDDGNTNPQCITCGLKNSAGHLCEANSAEFSDDFVYFIHNCKGPDIPETTTRFTQTGEAISYPGPTFVNNAELRQRLENKKIPINKDYTIPITNKFLARARLYIPPNFDTNKKYPLLVSVYAGPGSQSISQEHGLTWEHTLVSDKNVIVALIDGRGSGGQSTDLMFAVYRQLGTVEVEDQIAITKWLIEKIPQIDPNRTSIYGGSYGGYVAAKALEIDKDGIFKCGISQAPVTNWRYYDTTYTESYMGLPTEEDNLAGYLKADLTSKENVEGLRNKEFLLIHSTADDTVHYQHSMLLARSLQKREILFQQLSYPEEGHAVEYREPLKHLHRSIERFLFRSCFQTFEYTPEKLADLCNFVDLDN